MAESTFGINKYGFTFISFFILDSTERSLPFIQIISSNEQTHVIEYCLNILISYFPNKDFTEIKFFCSDMAPNFFNAVKLTFGKNHHINWIYCEYHFNVAVIDNILKRIKKRRFAMK